MAGGLRPAILCFAALAACAPQTSPQTNATGPLRYLGVETKLLEDDLVNFVVKLENAVPFQASDYARCAAAQYAQIRGYGFARHVRTQVSQEAGILVGDAIYTISPTLPAGVRIIDAQAVVKDCKAEGIPTV